MKQTTVMIGKTEYSIEHVADTNPERAGDVPYILRAKNKTYYMLRNINRPYLMFPLADGMRSPKWWISDKDGIIKQVEVM